MSRIVHLGLGNFHRAHQAVYTQAANGLTGSDHRITAVSFRNRALVQAMRAQQGRYTVLEVGPGAAPPLAVDAIDQVLLAADEPDRVVAAVADPGTTTITLTVTEKGYAFRPGSHDLDGADPAVARDATLAHPPTSTVGILAAGLLARADHGTPLDLVSCDNVGHNGAGLRTVLEQYAGLLPSAQGVALLGYLATVGTPDTMVDRIVPRTTDATRTAVARAGIDDQVPVPAEPFSMWVLAGQAFTAPRPAWETVGAILSDEVGAYELVKLRLLNAPNSLLAYLGILTGKAEIADAAADPVMRAAADQGLGDEMQPTIDLPAGFDPAAYRAEVFARFANHELAHLCQQVGTDGSLKLTQRVPAAVAWHADRGHTPDHLALLVAAWLRVTADATQIGIAPHDLPIEPARERVGAVAAKARNATDLARAVLVDEAMLGSSLTTQAAYVDRVADLLDALRHRPTDQVVRSLNHVQTQPSSRAALAVADSTR